MNVHAASACRRIALLAVLCACAAAVVAPTSAHAAGEALVVDTTAGTALAEAGATQSVVVSLASQPTDDVTVHALDDGQLDASPATVTFTTADWNVPRVLVVAAVDDALDEPDSHVGMLELAATSDDTGYSSLPSTFVAYAIQDDDTAGVGAAPGALSLAEAGGAATQVDVVLASQPVASVTVTLDGADDVAPATSTLVFTPGDWNVPQSVSLSAVDDAIEELDPDLVQVAVSVASTDPAYASLAVAPLDATIDDDDGARTATATFVGFGEGSTSSAQHADGSTLWFNPAASGSFSVTGSGSASASVRELAFEAPGAAGWSGGGVDPSEDAGTYAASYSWTAGAAEPATRSIVTYSTSGVESAPATFAIRADSTPPSGTVLHAQTTVTRDTSAPVSATAETDAESGIGSWVYGRRVAPLVADACGAFGSWAVVGPESPSGGVSDAGLAAGTCVQYRVVVTDNVGNAEVVTQDGELKVDRTAPVATFDQPAGPIRGTVVLTGTASDATTRVRAVGVIVEDRYSICPNAPVDASGRWSCTWTIGEREVGPANLKVTVTDATGQRTSASLSVVVTAPPNPFGPREEDIDRTPPVVGLARMPAISWTDKVKVKPSGYDDSSRPVELRVEQRTARASNLRYSPWTPSFEESDYVTLEERGETTCFRATGVDESGNRATSDPRCTTLPYDDIDLAPRGDWDEVAARRAWMGSLRRTTRRGSSLTVRVADATPILVVRTCPRCGRIRVKHGRRVLRTYSLASRRVVERRLIALPRLRRASSAALQVVAMNGRPVFIDGLVAAP